MKFSKQFPKTVDGSNYPRWIEIYLEENEEKDAEDFSRNENIKIMLECLEDAENIMMKRHLNSYQSDLVNIATSLFEKRASHTVHIKENKCKEKFDRINNKT